MNAKNMFAKYVSQNILGMIGISVYILADTFFISLAVGADGITALNLVLPVYNLIFAIGSMIGVGSAIRHTLARSGQGKEHFNYFSNALIFATLFGLLFSAIGILIPDRLIGLLGGDAQIVQTGTTYTRIFMTFAPCFMWNYIFNAFVRNDGAPSVAMAATLAGSLFNIVMDYVLMFPLKMGMAGAALATALSPLLGVFICCIHIFSKKSRVSLRFTGLSLKKLFGACQVGVSAFVGEISSGVITVVFNLIILRLAGNVGVAAYGVVANISLVAVSVFNGVSQGSQPLISSLYGKGDKKTAATVLRMGLCTSLALAVLILAVILTWAAPIANIFNKEQDLLLSSLAETGLKLYFTGFLFAGLNIVAAGALSAAAAAKWAFVTSILRGFAAIIFFAFLLSDCFGMNGVWLAFPAAELLTLAVTAVALRKTF